MTATDTKPTAAQRRAIDMIRGGGVSVFYARDGRGCFAFRERGLRVDVLDRVIEAGWAEVSPERRPTEGLESIDWLTRADVVLTSAGAEVSS